jgi:hypothetical protein
LWKAGVRIAVVGGVGDLGVLEDRVRDRALVDDVERRANQLSEKLASRRHTAVIGCRVR